MARRAKKAKTTRRKTARRVNPIARNTRRQLAGAVRLYEKFREAEPRYVDTLRVNPTPPVLMEIGKLDGVLYTTTHAGKSAKYIHKFNGKSRPTLATDSRGKRLFILGGRYDFTEDGIVDRKD